jgi:ABC-2 type transport system permease protein
MLAQRRRSAIWWSVAVGLLAWAIAASYPSIAESADAFNEYVSTLPEGVVDLLGNSSMTSPAGYLTSQFYGNMFPLLLITLGVGAAAWSIAGSQADGTLEMLLANPIRRSTVGLSRFTAVAVLVFLVDVAATLVMAAIRGLYQLESLSVPNVFLAGVGSYLLAMLFAAVAFGFGAATGSRGIAIAGGSGVAAGTYVIFALSGFVSGLANLKWVSPWYWFLNADPLASGPTSNFWLTAVLLPVGLMALCVLVGIVIFAHRDLR